MVIPETPLKIQEKTVEKLQNKILRRGVRLCVVRIFELLIQKPLRNPSHTRNSFNHMNTESIDG